MYYASISVLLCYWGRVSNLLVISPSPPKQFGVVSWTWVGCKNRYIRDRSATGEPYHRHLYCTTICHLSICSSVCKSCRMLVQDFVIAPICQFLLTMLCLLLVIAECWLGLNCRWNKIFWIWRSRVWPSGYKIKSVYNKE